MEYMRNQTNESEMLPKRNIGLLQKSLILLIVIALVGGSAAGMWVSVSNYLRNRAIGWEGLAERGDEALMTGDYTMAIEHYRKAIDLEPAHPQNASIYAQLGTAYYYAGDMQSALYAFQQALNLEPNHWGALYSTGVIYHYHLKDYRQAAAVWQRMMEFEWNDTEIESHIAELLQDAEENLQQIR